MLLVKQIEKALETNESLADSPTLISLETSAGLGGQRGQYENAAYRQNVCLEM